MRVKKEHFIILLIMILFFFFLFLPNIVVTTIPEEIKYKVTNIITVLIIIFLIFITFNDIRKREFTTTLYIVLLDIIGIIYFVILCYTFLDYPDKMSLKGILIINKIHITGSFIVLCGPIVRNYLKSNKFLKKNKCL